AYHIATTQSRQERDSYLALHALTLGGSLARHDITTVLDGPGAELILNGLYLLGGSQHADHHTVIDHAQPHCASHEFFNGVLAERAHGVFNGRIIVRAGAQRTDSKQTNNNLLLSTEARADSQPQLEIYADDVKCTHGSTVGPLDQTALYYLRSRGLSPETALRAIADYYRTTNANVHRGAYSLAIRATEAYEAARAKIAGFVNAWAPEGVVFTRGTTESINLVAGSYGRAHVGRGDTVVVTAMDHHSNVVPWQILCQEHGATLRMVEITEDGRVDLSDFGT